MFAEATQIEPGYAQAYAGMARAAILAGVNPQLPTRGHFDGARAAAQRALAIDANLAEAHAALGQLSFMSWRWQEAEQAFLRAIQLDPSNEWANEKYAFFLAARGRADEGVTQMIKVREIDPLSPAAAYSTATALMYAGRSQEALAESQRALKLDKDNPVANAVQGRVLALLGRFDDAKAAFAHTSGNAMDRISCAVRWRAPTLVQERRAEALAVAHAFGGYAAQPGRAQPELLGYLYARLGDADKAIASLNRALDEQPDRMLWLKVDPRTNRPW